MTLARIGLAVVGRDLNVLGVLHDVIVGDGIAVGGDEEAGALAGDELMAATLAVVRHAEPFEETLERRAGRERQIVIAWSPDSAGRSILTRTEITAGFTFSTMSAKPDRALRQLLACCGQILRMRRTGENRRSGSVRREESAAAPKPAIVVARSATRRADRIAARGWS